MAAGIEAVSRQREIYLLCADTLAYRDSHALTHDVPFAVRVLVVEQETSLSIGADRLKKAPTAPLTYSVAQSEADDKTKCDRHGNLHEQGRTFKNSTKGDHFVDSVG